MLSIAEVTRHTTSAAVLFTVLTTLGVLFQLALAAGMPWGHLAMGGRFPGRFPPAMRLAALFQTCIIAALGLIVLARAELLLPALRSASGPLIWVVVGFCAVSTVLNLATPSRWERILWGPVALGLLGSSVVVGLS